MGRYVYIPGVSDHVLGLSDVAKTGKYADLTGTPTLAAVATSGSYASLTGTPTLATVATSGAWADISGKPTFATVATSGSYASLIGTPTIPANTGDLNNNAGFTTLTAVTSTANTFSAVQKYVGIKETKVDLGTGTTINLDAGSYFTKTITGATTLTISGTLVNNEGRSFILELTNGGLGTIGYNTVVPKWAGGTTPTLTSAGRDILGFYCVDGTTWNAMLLAKDIK